MIAAMNSTLVLEGSIRGRVGGVLGLLRTVIVNAGAWVVDAQSLGGLVLVVRFESDDFVSAAMASALAAAGVQLAPPSQRSLAAVPDGARVTGSLSVTLVREGPDERVDVPSVPG